MSNCKTCKYFNGCAVVGNKDEPCYSCLTASPGWLPNYEEDTPKVTKADRIRAMTDEELATTMHDMTLIATEIGLSTEWWLQWLKSPVEVDE